jgi:hypothetical protein
MHDQTAEQLLAKVMGWQDLDEVQKHLSPLQLLANYKYDHYQRFGPGWRFIESLALWLHQFSSSEDRKAALKLVREKLIYFSESEFAHLVRTAYPDWIVQERIRLVAEEQAIPAHRVGEICRHRRFKELQLKSLYLGLSDGARTNELRRASSGEISNEQIWQAYELGEDKADDMLKELGTSLLLEWAEKHEQRVYAQLDSLVGQTIPDIPSHPQFEGTIWLQAEDFISTAIPSRQIGY